MKPSSPSFLWHDYETFGADPRRDRPAQFAAIRTDDKLAPIGDAVVIYCQPSQDMLPQPDACLITGITPQLARERGLPEPAFATQIHQLMSEPDTCSVGYNNFRFDDEVSRFLFWRNFLDPYAREYSNGNSRFDLIDLMRMCCALRPQGLNWPLRDDGKPSFRLEDLAAANGLDVSRAHDALADVEATIGLARLLLKHQPRLWQWALSLRQKHVVSALLGKGEILLHSSARLGASHCATAPILPLAPHPQFNGQWLAWNLNIDPAQFAGLDQEQLGDRLWTPSADLPEGTERLPVKLIRANRCPMISPFNVLDAEARQRLAIDPGLVADRAARLRGDSALISRLTGLFAASGGQSPDPELALYDGFIPRSDQPTMARVRLLDEEALIRLGEPFADRRLNELLFRYRARHFPNSLDADDQARWQSLRRRRLLEDPELASIRWPEYQARLTELRHSHPEHGELWHALDEWAIELGLTGANTG